MPAFPGSPIVARGAIVAIDALDPTPNTIIFQHNPGELTRSIQTTGNPKDSKAEPYRLEGPPRETITASIQIDAATQLERNDPQAVDKGIHPQLAALELLVYPSSTQVIANTVLSFLGSVEIVPPTSVLTLFIWGSKRVLPVQLNSFSITEQIHDSKLNPIQAKVNISMQVLNYNDFGIFHPGYYMFLTHQLVKEAMSRVTSVDSNLNF